MQLKNTEGPSQGSLPPRVAEAPPNPRCEVNSNRGPILLRHRCPLNCSHVQLHAHAHSTTEGPAHKHPSNTERRQGAAGTYTQSYHSNTRLHYQHHHHSHYSHHQPPPFPHQQQTQQGVAATGMMISRGGVGGMMSGVTECRVPPLPSPPYLSTLTSRPSPTTNSSSPQQPLIPLDFRRRAIKYMSTRLQVGVNVEEQSVREIERRILTLEGQVYESSVSQDEYASKLASRLAAILQHLDKCRSPRTPPVPHQSQQEPVM